MESCLRLCSDKRGSTGFSPGGVGGEQHIARCSPASVWPGSLQTHQIPHLTSTTGHEEHVIGQHTAAAELAAEQAGGQITANKYREKSGKHSAVRGKIT